MTYLETGRHNGRVATDDDYEPLTVEDIQALLFLKNNNRGGVGIEPHGPYNSVNTTARLDLMMTTSVLESEKWQQIFRAAAACDHTIGELVSEFINMDMGEEAGYKGPVLRVQRRFL